MTIPDFGGFNTSLKSNLPKSRQTGCSRLPKTVTGMTHRRSQDCQVRQHRWHPIRPAVQNCLKSGDYNVTEAATMTGFNDLGHFREVFKKEFGVTPSDYIKA